MKKIKIKKNYCLKKLTTFKIGGNAQYYCKPRSIDQLKKCLTWANDNHLPIIVIGGGSNLLIADKGINGLVISICSLKKIKIDRNKIFVEAGYSIKKLNQYVLAHSLSGLEFTGGLPGTIGGAVFMNARAYGNEMSSIVDFVVVLTKDGQIKELNKNELQFTYKHSIFMQNSDYIIIQICLNLIQGNYFDIKHQYKMNERDRMLKNQYKYPSAGCIFKNDYQNKIITGQLIDDLGLKGMKIGGAQISYFHGNFIINTRHATSSDVLKLIELIEDQVYQLKGIKLHREIILLGF